LQLIEYFYQKHMDEFDKIDLIQFQPIVAKYEKKENSFFCFFKIFTCKVLKPILPWDINPYLISVNTYFVFATLDINSICLWIGIIYFVKNQRKSLFFVFRLNYRTRFGSISFSLIIAQFVNESSSVGHFVAINWIDIEDILSKKKINQWIF